MLFFPGYESICDGFCETLWTMGGFLYPYGIKSRTLRWYPGRFGPGSFLSGKLGLSHFGHFFVVSALKGGSFRPDFLGGISDRYVPSYFRTLYLWIKVGVDAYIDK